MTGDDISEVQAPSLPVKSTALIALIAILTLIVPGLIGAGLWHDRTLRLHEAEARAGNLDLILERYLFEAIHGADVSLAMAANEFQREGANHAAFTRYLETQQQLLPDVTSLRATDERGIIRYGAGVIGAPTVDVSDRDYFLRSREGGGLVIGQPVLARLSRQWVMPLARPLIGADGAFGGAVYVNIALKQILDTFTSLDLGKNGVADLFDGNRKIVVRYPEPEGVGSTVGRTIGTTAFLMAWQQDQTAATVRSVSAVDGIPRTFAYRRISGYPLYVLVGLADDDVLAPWRREVEIGALMAALFVLVTTGAAFQIHRHWHQQVTAAIQYTAQLAQSEGELKRSNTELEQFAYVVSHDLRQPLRMINSYLGLIRRRLPEVTGGEIGGFFDFAQDGAQRMDRMILDILDYSRIGRGEPVFAPVALSDVAAEAMLNLAAAIQEADAAITIAPDLPVLPGDRALLTRLLQNLLANALAYRSPDRRAAISLTAVEEASFWRIGIADNGIGIAFEDLDRVFGMFQRAANANGPAGTGIGLAVCKKIAQHHKGRIWAESTPGTGTTFWFRLPKS